MLATFISILFIFVSIHIIAILFIFFSFHFLSIAILFSFHFLFVPYLFIFFSFLSIQAKYLQRRHLEALVHPSPRSACAPTA